LHAHETESIYYELNEQSFRVCLYGTCIARYLYLTWNCYHCPWNLFWQSDAGTDVQISIE